MPSCNCNQCREWTRDREGEEMGVYATAFPKSGTAKRVSYPRERWWERSMEALRIRAEKYPVDVRWAVYLSDAIQRCPTCFHKEAFCKCETCQACQKLYTKKRLCERCGKCKLNGWEASCCTCIQCGKCLKWFDALCETCARCETCCECMTCTACDHQFFPGDYCRECERCTDCCECPICDTCGVLTTTLCAHCRCCAGCCDCKGHEIVHFVANPLTFHEAKKEDRLVAVEIEVAGVRKNAKLVEEVVKKWQASVVRDGSLPQYGFEINTAPASGDKFVEEIQEFGEVLKKAEAFVTPRCGLHVHVDARKFSYPEIRRLMFAYAAVEPTLLQMVSSKRLASNYCNACAEQFMQNLKRGSQTPAEIKSEVQRAIYGVVLAREDEQYVKRDKHHDARYKALNFHSWLYRGTVECRLFSGTVKAEKIIPWGKLWATMLDYVAAHTDDEVETLLDGKPRENLAKILSVDPALDGFVEERIAYVKDAVEKKIDIDSETA